MFRMLRDGSDLCGSGYDDGGPGNGSDATMPAHFGPLSVEAGYRRHDRHRSRGLMTQTVRSRLWLDMRENSIELDMLQEFSCT